MNPEVVAALIAGIFAICAPILTLLLKQYFDNRDKLPISAGRREALTGRWEGKVRQDDGPNGKPIEFDASVEISAGRKTVSGVLTTRIESNGTTDQSHFNCTGGFFHGMFLQLNYTPKDESTIQFGSVIMELDAAGNVLEGRYAGYGKHTRAVVSGTAKLEKVK